MTLDLFLGHVFKKKKKKTTATGRFAFATHASDLAHAIEALEPQMKNRPVAVNSKTIRATGW